MDSGKEWEKERQGEKAETARFERADRKKKE